MKYNDNGTYEDIYVKTFDTLPVGSEVDYDGQTVPSGWEEVTDMSGSNANGSWIKFDDGTMICYNTYSNTINITSGYEGVYYGNTGTITFPIKFANRPILFTQTNLAGGGFTYYGYNDTSFSGFVWKTQSKSSASVDVYWLAIGRWKA